MSSLHWSDIQGDWIMEKVGSSQTGHVRILDLISDESQHLRSKGDAMVPMMGGAVREKPQTDMKWEKSKNKKHVAPPGPCALAPSVPPRLFPFPVHGLVVDIVYAIRAASV